MINFSNYTALINSYTKFLAQSNVAKANESFHLKWLRYYLDFCQKYSHKSENPSTLPKFIEKLKTKNQSDANCHQAEHTVSLYYNLINGQGSNPVKHEYNDKVNDLPSVPVADNGQKDSSITTAWDRVFKSRKAKPGTRLRPRSR